MGEINVKTLKEVYGYSKKKRLSNKSLKKIILDETIKVLIEQGETAEEKSADAGGFASVTTSTNIADLDGSDAYRQLVSGDESAPLVQAMINAEPWASGAVSKAGGVEAIKKWAEGVGEADLSARISKIGSSLPGSAPAKVDMPALEGEDAANVADALSPGGKYNIDLAAVYAGDSEDFDAWYDGLSDEDKASYDAGKVPSADKNESFIREDKYPRQGKSPMPGGGADAVGKALAFLTKGMADGNPTDDNISVTQGGSIANSKMVPTQSNILAGKSMLFAFLQGTGNTDLSDMGGAFVTSAGEILDGHHRWSGAYIGTGGGLTHSNVHVVDGDKDTLIPMLVSVGNALGRSQKESRTRNNKDQLIMERWKTIAGIV